MESIKAEEVTSKFLADANTAVNLRLVRSPKELHDSKSIFHPGMSHHVFGPQENIFGYSDLKINLFYTAGKLTQLYYTTFDEVISKDENGVSPDDIEEKLNKHEILQQENSAANKNHFEDLIRKDSKFRPFGEKITEFKRGDRIFEVYKSTKADPGFIQWYLRLETFIMWYIDGAIYIDTEDGQWDYYVTFEKYKNDELENSFAVAGFSTVFRYYVYPEKIRPRISQILIFPPFQRMGLGADFLQTICMQYHRKDVLELTMEDPSPEIQRVRDFNDARACLALSEFKPERLDKGFHLAMYSAACEAAKINRRQSRRVYEILRYRSTPKHDPVKMKAFRIDIKNRLNLPYKNETVRKMRINLQSGVQLTDEDRKKLLHAEYEEVIEHYDKVVERLDRYDNEETKIE